MSDTSDAAPTRATNPERWRGLIDPELRGETVLVTGGAGFVGGHLVDALSSVADVRVLDDFSNGSPADLPEHVTVHEGDVRSRDDVAGAMEDVAVVFHEAGLVSVPASVERPVESHRINVSGTVEVLEAARQEDARVVFASSAAAYGTPDDVPIDEDDSLAPESPYGADKAAADGYVRTYAETYDLPAVALRYFNVYGPGQGGGAYSGVIETFLDQAATGGPLTVHGDGTQTRDFVHVADVVQANLLAATTDAVGRSYNVGTGDAVSVNELAETVREVTDSAVDVVHTDPRPGDVTESRATVSRARSDLSYEPLVDLETGLRDLVTHRRDRRAPTSD